MKRMIFWACLFVSLAARAGTPMEPASVCRSHCAAFHGA